MFDSSRRYHNHKENISRYQMKFACKYCGNDIPDERSEYAIRHGMEPRFCSTKCSYSYKHFRMSKAEYESRLIRKCKFCGNTFKAKTIGSGYCSTNCQKAAYYYGWKTKDEVEAAREADRKTRETECEKIRNEVSEFEEVLLLDASERFATVSKWPEDKKKRFKAHYCAAYGVRSVVTPSDRSELEDEESGIDIIRENEDLARREADSVLSDSDNGEFE